MSEGETASASAYISAGGVEIRIESSSDPGTLRAMAYELWQKVYDQLLLKEPMKERPKPGAGTGFLAERAEPIPPGDWLGENGPKMDVRSEEGQRAAEALGMLKGKKECFHPWPGCNC
jgi:hypothetical protein